MLVEHRDQLFLLTGGQVASVPGEPARGLHIRLVGSAESRAKRIARLLGLTPHQALACGRRVDHVRRDYVRSFFEADIDDDGAYDLVLNMDRFTTESAADLLVAVLRSRGWVEASGDFAPHTAHAL